jgi:hypothetical protein
VFIDDAYIFYRYADNWANGLGPVFNRGEYVEGFTSFLWLAVVTLASTTGAAVEDVAPVLGLAAAVGCAVLTAGAARRLFPSRPLLASAATLAAALPTGVAYYAASGMDAPAFALALTAAAVAVARRVERGQGGTAVACVALVALVLVRAEGVVYAAGILAVAFVFTRRAGTARSLVPLAIAVLVATAAVFVTRAAVYDALVPASVSAKSAATHHLARGDVHALLQVLRAGLRYEGVAMLAMLALLAVGLTRRRRGLPPLVAIGALVVALSVAITVWAGGDWMSYRRHVVPVLPLLALVATWTAAANAGPWRGRAGAPALALGALACVLTVAAAGYQPGRLGAARGPEHRYLTEIGRVLRATPHTRLLTNAAGALPYRAGDGTYTWDLLGLTDRHNSRHGDVFVVPYGRTDYDYSFSRSWDVLVTLNTGDVSALFDRLAAGDPLGPMLYLDSGAWTRERLSVLVRPRAASRAALERRCRCRAVGLTPAARARIRAELGLPRAGAQGIS